MNFKQIEMVGFKSFADPIKITFDSGITAIVGPNGCGKSNVADAIRWVLGEQSSKMLRGTSMQDVIFKGTEKRKSLSFCEVSLVFDNTNKIFKSDYDEICITRKLYRSGESDYLLNHTNCRLKDIFDLLYDSGIGKSGYSIIGQGKVEEIINSKPVDRRAIFEEAAGIAGYKAKKVDAERKLERTRDNLTRINDIVSEIDRQLKPLKHQAEVARKYLDLKEKLKLQEVNAYIYQYDYAASNKAEIETKINAIVEELNLRQGNLDNVILEYNNTFNKVNSIDSEITHLRDEILNITVEIEKQAGETNLIREKIRNCELESSRLNSELRKLNESNLVLTEELNNKQTLIKNKRLQHTGLTLNLEEVQKTYNKINEELLKSEDEANETQRKLFETLSKLGDVKAQISALNAEKSTYSEQLKTLNQNIQNVDVKILEGKQRSKSCNEMLSKLNSARDTLNAIVNKMLAEQSGLENEYKTCENEINTIKSNIVSLDHRKTMLEDMQREYEGFSGSVKRLLTDAEKNSQLKNKIVGVFANLIKVPGNFQAAIEMALGNAVQNIVTLSDDGAKDLINYLKENEYGRVTFLPINSIKSRKFEDIYKNILNEKGVFGLASELIYYDRKIENIVSNLLGATVVVDNISTAVSIAKRSDYGFRIVTLDGDVINPQGSITGGSKKAQVANLLSRESEIESAKKMLQKLAVENKDAQERFDAVTEQLNNLNANLKQNLDKLHNIEISIAQETERQNKFNQICFDLENEKTLLLSEIAKTNKIIDGISQELLKINHPKNLSAETNGLEETSQFGKMRAVRDDYGTQLTNLKIDIASICAEILGLESDLQRLNFALSNNAKIRAEVENNIDNNQKLLTQLKNIVDAPQDHVEVNTDLKKLENVKKNLEQLTNLKLNLQSALRSLEEQRMNLGGEVNRLQDKKYQQEINLSKIDTDIEALQERVWTEYELTYATALDYKLPQFDVKQGLIEVNNLRREINKLGNINVNAIEDSQLLEARHGNLYAQAQDLLKAESDLQQIIKDLSSEMTSRFEDAFNAINTNFGLVFKELFGGGSAKLQLVESENSLEAGVDIIAEPPGKKLSNITLLSGGEKALTAIAILFGILRLKPMPFCLLDEIEAALDEANVARFAKYLQKYSGETQFIVITHKKPTMEHADALYGVTMEEKGVSKIVSVKLTEAIKNIEEN